MTQGRQVAIYHSDLAALVEMLVKMWRNCKKPQNLLVVYISFVTL